MKKKHLTPLYYSLILTLLLFSGVINKAWSQNPGISIDTLSDNKNKSLTIVISAKNAPNQVRSCGFDINYDSAALNYSDYTKGELTEKFTMFEARKIKDGHIRAGGFMAGKEFIRKGDSGKLIILHFKMLKKADFKIKISNFIDDISLWKVEEQ